MMSFYIIGMIFALLNQRITCITSSEGGSNENKNLLNLEDLIRWWDHDSPEWAKAAENKADVYLNYYYPIGPGADFDDSVEYQFVPEPERKSDPTRSRPGNEKSKWFENKPPFGLFKETTERAQWFQRSPDFILNTRPPSNLITRFTRQSFDMFANQNPSGTSPASPTLEQCMKTCPLTTEYNPICGTDNVTYNNRGQLECARFCGKGISVQKNAPCSNSNNGFVENSSQPAPVNRPTDIEVTANINSQTSRVQSCINSCPRRGENAPVCGSDGITYESPGHLLCAQFCGVDVRVRDLSACPRSNDLGTNTGSDVQPNPLSNMGSNSANKVNAEAKPTNNAGSTWNSNSNKNSFNEDVETTIIPPHIRSCLRSCPTTSEHNPVCGSNNIIYTNPGRLSCARICGVDVQTRPITFCRPVPTTNTPMPVPLTNPTTPEPITTQNPLECTKSCRLPAEVNPVCGTNGITYKNLAFLQCVKMCGAEVDVKSYSSCQDEISTQRTSVVPKPVTEITTLPSSTSNNGLNFTIPLDILNSVFLNQPTTTTESEIDTDFIRIND